jgi:hypothetical protein
VHPIRIPRSRLLSAVHLLTSHLLDAGRSTAASARALGVGCWMFGVGCSAAAAAAAAPPTDNPVATRYGAAAYPWTDEIRWSNVFDIADYGAVADGNYTTSNGTDNTAAFNAARDAAAATGGGVVYFPAGTYAFADHIHLKNGVVIRGANPSGITDAVTAGYVPPTKLVFPRYEPVLSGNGTPNSSAFKKIYTTEGDTDSNLGVVNVDLNRGAINLQGAPNSGRNRNLVVFGVRSNNVAEADSGVPASFQNGWQRWSYRFAANIRLQAYANTLVANCRINDAITDNYEQPGYKLSSNGSVGGTITTLNASQSRFNYTDHYGIVAGRGGSSGNLSPHVLTEPSLFRPGVSIRDNYVFHTMRVALHASGFGMEITDNVVRDQSGKVHWVYPDGKRPVGNSSTLENRGIDWSGWNVVVDGNDIEVYRHLLNNGPYLSVDGEGILIQECCSGTLVNGVTIANNTVNSYIGLYKMQDIRNAVVANNTVSNSSLGVYVVANTNGGNFALEEVLVEHNTISGGGLNITGNITGANVTVRNNTDSDATPSSIIVANYVVTANNTGFGNFTSVPSIARNRSPYVELTRPAPATTAAGIDLVLEATASDPDGSIATVEFYNHQSLLVSDTAPPFTHTLSAPGPGEYMITAKAFDDLGRSYVSWPVYLRVLAAPSIESAGFSPTTGTGPLQLELRRPAPPTDLTFSLESSGNLSAGSWTDTPFTELSVERDGPYEFVRIQDDGPGATGAPARFLRLRTERP